METKMLLIVIAVLLLVIAVLISFGLGMFDGANSGYKDYRVESNGHIYTLITYGSQISAVHDPDCPCQIKGYKSIAHREEGGKQ